MSSLKGSKIPVEKSGRPQGRKRNSTRKQDGCMFDSRSIRVFAEERKINANVYQKAAVTTRGGPACPLITCAVITT